MSATPDVQAPSAPDSTPVALVTGASRGIGRIVALRLAAAGYYVVIGYARREREAQACLAQVHELGARGEVLKLRLERSAEVEASLAAVIERTGRVDVLVNNAALAGDGHFARQSAEEFDETIAVALGGAVRCARAVVRSMLACERGCIINVGSVITRRSQPGRVAYATAKGGVEAFTRALAFEVAARGVRVNAVIPGVIDAGMTDLAGTARTQDWKKHIPVRHFGRAEDIADAVMFLASDQARYITGHCLVVDGGLSL